MFLEHLFCSQKIFGRLYRKGVATQAVLTSFNMELSQKGFGSDQHLALLAGLKNVRWQDHGLSQRELNGTRLMVHAGNCRQFFAVLRCFLLFFAFP